MQRAPGFREFITIMALSMSLVALSIDAMLPALSQIADGFGVIRENDRQLVITVLFIGFALGQIVYGPVSDSIGRRKPIFFGFGLFIVGTVVAIFSPTFEWLLIGRFLQGLGAAGPRILTVAMIRDVSSGREMARIMSLVMMIFILVPAIAPALGQLVLLIAGWRMIFVALVLLAILTVSWFYSRQPETLAPENQHQFSIANIWIAFKEVCGTRVAVVYTLAGGLIFGAFIGFLSSSQQVLQELYGLGTKFPFYFAALALTIGVAAFINSRLVVVMGMRALSKFALWAMFILAAVFFVYCLSTKPSLVVLMTYLMFSFLAIGLLFGNLNSLAMEPLGHVAGLASSVIGSVTTALALSIGYLIGSLYDHNLLPMVAGFGVLAIMSLSLVYFGDNTRNIAPS